MADGAMDGLKIALNKLNALHENYSNLRQLLVALNGLPDSAPIPEPIQITGLHIEYRCPYVDSAQSWVFSAALNVRDLRVGDLYRLLGASSEQAVAEMRDLAAQIRMDATQIEAACTQAQFVLDAQQATIRP